MGTPKARMQRMVYDMVIKMEMEMTHFLSCLQPFRHVPFGLVSSHLNSSPNSTEQNGTRTERPTDATTMQLEPL